MGTAYPVDRFQVSQAGEQFLPYTLEVEKAANEATDREVLLRPVCILSTGRDSVEPAILLLGVNPYGAPENASILSLVEYPSKPITTMRLPYSIGDLCRYDDLQTGRPGALAAMFSADSVWLVRVIPHEARSEAIPLCAIPTKKPTDEKTRMLILAVSDYDFDGRTEALAYVYSPRPQDVRALFCVEVENGRIQWMLPVASPVLWGDLLCLPDSVNPRVIFTTRRQLLGNTDAVFDDRIGQLTVVDSAGGIVMVRTAQRYFNYPILRRAANANQFHLTHNAFDTLVEVDSSVSRQRRLSTMNSEGQLLRTTPLEATVTNLWTRPYGPHSIPALWLLFNATLIQVYDTSLTLLATSDSSDIGDFIGRYRLSPFDDSVMLFTTGVYTSDFRQLAEPPMYADDVHPLTYDAEGRVSRLVMMWPNGYLIGHYRPRGYLEMLTVLYVRYQTPMLMTVTGLVVVLVLVNFFRYRNKSTARLITRQKQELEQTHQALKEAQAMIVAQEKYRQARDIAGGFAHEIRNALFPAEAALHKLLNRRTPSADETETVRRYLHAAVAAVGRAIGVTELISSYTRLESEAAEEAVDLAAVIREVIEANRLRSQEQGVVVECPQGTGWWVRSNQKQLFMVINNLMVNSLDALTGRPSPRIVLTVGREAEILLLSVTDNGSGIAAEALPRVFDTFYSTKPNTGNGLGLAIAKRIVELYGGSISAASEPGAWARFDLRFRATSPHA